MIWMLPNYTVALVNVQQGYVRCPVRNLSMSSSHLGGCPQSLSAWKKRDSIDHSVSRVTSFAPHATKPLPRRQALGKGQSFDRTRYYTVGVSVRGRTSASSSGRLDSARASARSRTGQIMEHYSRSVFVFSKTQPRQHYYLKLTRRQSKAVRSRRRHGTIHVSGRGSHTLFFGVRIRTFLLRMRVRGYERPLLIFSEYSQE